MASESASRPTPAPRVFRHALLGLERTDPGPRFGAAVAELARGGTVLRVGHVVLRPTSVSGDDLDGEPANAEEIDIVRVLRARLGAWIGPGADAVPIRILHGDPGQRLCEHAIHADCDLLVLASRGHHSFADRLKGSVARYVVANSGRSVLIVGP